MSQYYSEGNLIVRSDIYDDIEKTMSKVREEVKEKKDKGLSLSGKRKSHRDLIQKKISQKKTSLC